MELRQFRIKQRFFKKKQSFWRFYGWRTLISFTRIIHFCYVQ